VYFFVSFGFVYSRDIFCVEGFPLQRPDWRVIYCNGLLYVFPTRNTLKFLINFIFQMATYFSKAQYSLFELKVPLNPNHSFIIPTNELCINVLAVVHCIWLQTSCHYLWLPSLRVLFNVACWVLLWRSTQRSLWEHLLRRFWSENVSPDSANRSAVCALWWVIARVSKVSLWSIVIDLGIQRNNIVLFLTKKMFMVLKS